MPVVLGNPGIKVGLQLVDGALEQRLQRRLLICNSSNLTFLDALPLAKEKLMAA